MASVGHEGFYPERLRQQINNYMQHVKDKGIYTSSQVVENQYWSLKDLYKVKTVIYAHDYTKGSFNTELRKTPFQIDVRQRVY